MIKKSICILLLLGAVAAVVFAILDRKNTHTLLPLPSNKVVKGDIKEVVNKLEKKFSAILKEEN